MILVGKAAVQNMIVKKTRRGFGLCGSPGAALLATCIFASVHPSAATAQGGVPPALADTCDAAVVKRALQDASGRRDLGEPADGAVLLVVTTLGMSPTRYQIEQLAEYSATKGRPLEVLMFSAEDSQAKLDEWHLGHTQVVKAVFRASGAVWAAPLSIDRAPTSFLLDGKRCTRFRGAAQASQIAESLTQR